MKILAIRGCNLASLEGEFEIDFTAEPLRSAGIFAITGSTGSGKSTILDAVCLALFNDTPRINKVERDTIVDVKDSLVSLGDSRNILRRGTAYGYAEVDFLSLGGSKYRSRWSVRRARGKASGSMQPYSLELTNLTDGVQEQGGKAELLLKIKELIGLSFHQFTRAVLLAQGDFATFLKASKSEKADLLEKLTGTDIYSRISAKIYLKSGEAKSALEVVERNIAGVELLTDEQVVEFNEQVTTLEQNIKELEKEEEIIKEKINWIDKDAILLKGVSEAKELLNCAVTAESEAKERFEYLAKIDSVQGIRDSYKELESVKEQLLSANKKLAELQEQQELNSKSIKEYEPLLQNATTNKEGAEKELLSAEPNIIKARELDIKVASVNSSLIDANKELDATKELGRKTKERGGVLKKEIEAVECEQKSLTNWFNENCGYAEIVDKSPLIINYINDALSSDKSFKSNSTIVENSELLLKGYKESLEKWVAESERLNSILPTEVATLRLALVDGEPCAVCGSTHHPISQKVVDTLEQQELTKAKESAKKEIERIENNIKRSEAEVISLRAIIEGYKKQYKELISKLDELLGAIPEWREFFNNGKLAEIVAEKTKSWRDNEKKSDELKSAQGLKVQELEGVKSRLEEIVTQYKEREQRVATVTLELGTLKEERAKLFNGESVEVIEKRYKETLSTTVSALEDVMEHGKKLSEREKEISGAIYQVQESITQFKKRGGVLQEAVDEWLVASRLAANTTNNNLQLEIKDCSSTASNASEITADILAQLLSNSSEWVTAERSALDKIKGAVATAKTTLVEREKVHSEHRNANIKPTEEESKEFLLESAAALDKELLEKRDLATQIKVRLAKYKTDIELVKRYRAELEAKREVANNWQKLNELFGSADGGKFKTMAQGYTLDVLLGYANKHLSEISNRYVLERVSTESLALQVRDLDMLSEVRSVHSLSGGESFLISLSLALGLSSLSSNRMSVESLFIDEGFGTLDADTLRTAMDVLERLQTQGRKIGVISHVAEMTERISSQIQVVKTSNGRSSIVIR